MNHFLNIYLFIYIYVCFSTFLLFSEFFQNGIFQIFNLVFNFINEPFNYLSFEYVFKEVLTVFFIDSFFAYSAK